MRSIRIRSLNIQCTNCVQKLNQTVHISLHVILEGGGVCFRFLSYATVSPNDGSMFFLRRLHRVFAGHFLFMHLHLHLLLWQTSFVYMLASNVRPTAPTCVYLFQRFDEFR